MYLFAAYQLYIKLEKTALPLVLVLAKVANIHETASFVYKKNVSLLLRRGADKDTFFVLGRYVPAITRWERTRHNRNRD